MMRRVQLVGGPQDGQIITTDQPEIRFPIYDPKFDVMTYAIYRLDRIHNTGFIARFVDETIQ